MKGLPVLRQFHNTCRPTKTRVIKQKKISLRKIRSNLIKDFFNFNILTPDIDGVGTKTVKG